jgi:hypothetical protein
LFSPISNLPRHFSLKRISRAADPLVVAQRSKAVAENLQARAVGIRSERLRPIRTVVRELTRPDGTTIRVEVPVYPPFRLKERSKPKDPGTSD